MAKRHSLSTEALLVSNAQWLEDLQALIASSKEAAKLRKQSTCFQDELNGRIADVCKLGELYNHSKSTRAT